MLALKYVHQFFDPLPVQMRSLVFLLTLKWGLYLVSIEYGRTDGTRILKLDHKMHAASFGLLTNSL